MRHALVGILLSGLGSTALLTAQGTAPDAYDGCAFVSAAEVEATMGGKLSRRPRVVRTTLGTVETYGCNYRSETFTVEVRLEAGRSRDDLQMYLKALGATVKQTTASALQPVSGIGDGAWWGPVNATSGIFHVVDGTDVLWVQTYGKSAGAGSLEKTRAVMDKVFAHYKGARK
jgi:hypothetical protein